MTSREIVNIIADKESEIRKMGFASCFLEALEKSINNLVEEKTEKYKEALIWCSGSEDFQFGGKARIGWEKLCIPLLKYSEEGIIK